MKVWRAFCPHYDSIINIFSEKKTSWANDAPHHIRNDRPGHGLDTDGFSIFGGARGQGAALGETGAHSFVDSRIEENRQQQRQLRLVSNPR